jgi:hypothetical protein
MDCALLNGDPSFQDSLTAKGKDIEADIAKVDDVDQQLGAALVTSKKWSDCAPRSTTC